MSAAKTVAARTFYLSYGESELGRLPGEAANVIGLATDRLFTRDIAPAIGLHTEQLLRIRLRR